LIPGSETNLADLVAVVVVVATKIERANFAFFHSLGWRVD
jgi:hypothetical protein